MTTAPPPAPAPAAVRARNLDHVAVLPSSLADKLRANRPMDLRALCKVLTNRNNNVRYVNEPFTPTTPQPLREECGDFELVVSLGNFVGSTEEALLRNNQTAHRIYVYIQAGAKFAIVRVHRLPFWPGANMLITAIANEALKRGLTFLPINTPRFEPNNAREEEELTAIRNYQPDYAFTSVEALKQAGDEDVGQMLVKKVIIDAGAHDLSQVVLLWEIASSTCDVQGHGVMEAAIVKLWIFAKPELLLAAPIKQEKISINITPPPPSSPVVTEVKQQQQGGGQPTQMSGLRALASGFAKKRRNFDEPADATMSM